MDVVWTALSDDLAVPSSIVVNVNDAHVCTGIDTALDLLVIRCEVGRIQSTAELVVDQELPAHCKTESVQAIVSDEVLHLSKTILARIDNIGCDAVTRSITAKVQSGNVHASIADFTSDSRTSCCCGKRKNRRTHDEQCVVCKRVTREGMQFKREGEKLEVYQAEEKSTASKAYNSLTRY